MNKVNGNLAYKTKYNVNNARPSEVLTSQDEVSVIRNFQKQMSKQRIFAMISFIALVTAITFAFAGILIRNSQLLEMNYANVKLEREISQMEKQTSILKEELAKKTNLDTIRQIATEQLLMQEPGQKQIATVVIPQTDVLIVESSEPKKDLMNDDMNEVFGNLEGFFKRFR